MGQHHERERLRDEQEKLVRAAQDRQIEKIIADTKRNYDRVKELIENPVANKAFLSLRAQVRRIRKGWLEKQLDAKIPHQEKDVLLGQYNACLLAFDILEQIKTVNREMVPGKEAEYIREKLFKNPHMPQPRQQ